jgi:endonuclease/exonuclease/phosphatase family metal-dependent hydrolase
MPLTVTTWNVQNFTDTDPVFADKLNYIAAVLQALDSDVIALQEVFNLNALQALASRLGFQQSAAAPDSRGIRVAFLTRVAPAAAPVPITQFGLPPGVVVSEFGPGGAVQTVAQFPRPALKVTVMHGGAPVDIITTHLKRCSRSVETSTSMRRCAHTALFALNGAQPRRMASKPCQCPLRPTDVIVLGDLNDGPEAATTDPVWTSGGQPRGPEDATLATGHFNGPTSRTRNGSLT